MRDGQVGPGLALALVSAATFGTSGSFARSLIDAGWSAEAAVTVRVGIAAVLLAVPALLALRARRPRASAARDTKKHDRATNDGEKHDRAASDPEKHEPAAAGTRSRRGTLAAIGLFGLLAVAGAQVAYFNAVRYLPVGVALLLEYSGIILVVLWMWVRHGDRPRRLTLAGSAAAAAGLVLVLDLAGGADLDPAGVAWGLVAAVGLATYFVVSSHVGPELPAVTLACGGMASGALILVLLGAVGILPLHASTGPVSFAGQQVSWLVPVAGLAVLAGAVSYVSGIGAARALGAALASFAGLTEVLFAVLFAWLLLGELPTLLQAVGGVFVLAGIALVRLDELRRGGAPHSDRVPDGGEQLLRPE
ncbi:EamA family transporter [Symbioplanes lichenis]|uniref:EamA family transporter n=1 Tax=Symbioplanes lichenis TaxID=1629072 RepID=UPI002739B826|nr:DMT family transporter [Actinoplanes lichenis]